MLKIRYIILIFCFIAINAFAQVDTITILHVNDTHSTLDAIGSRDQDLNGTLGGIARAASVIGYEQTVDPDLLLLHAGDISIGDLFFNKNFHVPELTWMSMMGFDAMAVGDHEFDLTPDVLLESLQYLFPAPSDAFLSDIFRMNGYGFNMVNTLGNIGFRQKAL